MLNKRATTSDDVIAFADISQSASRIPSSTVASQAVNPVSQSVSVAGGAHDIAKYEVVVHTTKAHPTGCLVCLSAVSGVA